MKRITITFCLWLTLPLLTEAQDVHFTHFFSTHVISNPALTGDFEGTYRFEGVARRQWASVSPQPYQTFAGNFDVNKPLNIKGTGVGLMFLHDNAGLSNLSTTSIGVPLALRLRLGASKNIALSLGFQPEYTMMSIDFSKLSFDEQFNGIAYDPNAPINEQFPASSVSFLNFNAGVYLNKRHSARSYYGAGFSVHNITEPNISGWASSEVPLPRRYHAMALTSFPIAASLDLMPAARYMWQGVHSELLVGTALRYHLREDRLDKKSVQVGLWGRTSDALNLNAGLQQNDLYLGLSYDFNLNPFQVATNYLGGWEFNLVYTLNTVREKTKRIRQCPDYL